MSRSAPVSSRRRWVRFGATAAVTAAVAGVVSPLAAAAVMVAAGAWVIINFTSCDPVTLLTCYVVALFAVPAVYVFKPLGAVGTPAVLVALIAAGWWATSRLSLSTRSAGGFQPIRLAMMAFVGGDVLTWAWAFSRPLEPLQARSADRALIGGIALGGIVLLAADGIATRERLDRLLKRLVGAGTFLAGLGILQFATGLNPAKFLRFPGLQLNGVLNSISQRSSFRRVSGTASHGIEFGVVLTMVLPIALHYAFESPRQHRLRAWIPVAVIMIAIPMSVSRSAIVGLAAIGVVLYPTWAWRRRVNVTATVVIGGAIMRAAIPGLLGTLKSLLFGASKDPSVQSRTGNTAMVFDYFVRSPWLGHGLGTYIPQEVHYLDNQYFGTIVETGLLGLVVTIALLGIGLGVARGGRRRSRDAAGRSLGQSLAASVLVAVVTFGTFDAMGFPINAGVLALIIGCAGAFWRLAGQSQEPSERFPASVPAGGRVQAPSTGTLEPVDWHP